MRVSVLLVCLMMCAASVSAVEKPQANASDKIVMAPAKKAPAEDLNRVVVTVNGHKITLGAVHELIAPQLKMWENVEPERVATAKKRFEQQAADMLVTKYLVEEKLKEMKLAVTDEQVIAKFTEIAQARGMTLDDFKARIEESGTSFDDAKKQVKVALEIETLLEKVSVDQKTEITDDQIKKFYTENESSFNTQEEVRASHILVDTRNLDEAAKAEAKKKAEDLCKKAKSGEDFAALAKEHSACPSKRNGGDLDYFSRGRMVPEFSEVAFKLKPGEISDVVETKFGYHVIKVTDHKDAEKKTYDQVKDMIKERLKNEAKQSFGMNYMKQMKDKADIKWSDAYAPPAPAQPPVEVKPEAKEKPKAQ